MGTRVFTENKFVDILTNERMPWIFRFPTGRNNKLAEPRNHKNGIKKLTKAIFYQAKIDFKNEVSVINKDSIVEFVKFSKNELLLEFDNGIQGKSRLFKSFNLKINY
ncbi:MAG TPA: hypothetical protein ENK75_01495 [Saprospiraceae bacterium]|nr:hypothetical protein [Saprospiraceae bacterium]